MFIQWIGDTLAKGAVVAGLLALAGWLFKQQISAWLSQDLERKKASYVQELEAKKAEYQRDLESYRVSLIAAAERSKAEAEVKKAGALRIVEKRFAAFDKLHGAIIGNAVEFLYIAKLSAEQKSSEQFESAKKRLDVLKEVFYSAEIFMSFVEREAFMSYRESLLKVFPYCLTGKPTLEGVALASLQIQLLEAEGKVDAIVKAQVDRMMLMS